MAPSNDMFILAIHSQWNLNDAGDWKMEKSAQN